jgi:hypothetical protein
MKRKGVLNFDAQPHWNYADLEDFEILRDFTCISPTNVDTNNINDNLNEEILVNYSYTFP